ncbi:MULTISPECIES: mechanosensitive ion channel domain-containing protein [Microbulbifer]|uniref:Mechanosensitive ion channel domain-containing protein n=1 Tax=Microbulbifer celer TaxID=435905 RepID=A0ABW3U8U2_9GAMM|nr:MULTISPECIES: mechanosensitive ion channel domain-containing protein [Microbulbifer]UFN57317.1 mechanosensitive ion channel [Microbulbifer celer]
MAQSAAAQLPSTKPKEIQPTIPDFQKLSADWWTDWPAAEDKVRQQWLEDLTKAWTEWSETLPEEVRAGNKVAAVNLRLESIRKVWEKRDEMTKSALLEDVEFPDDPTVLQWAESDAGVDKGRQRYDSLQLEAAQVDDSEAQTLSRMREQVLALRDGDNTEPKRLEGTVNLFLAQIAHLQVLEEQEVLQQLMRVWEEELKYAEGELQRMLGELQYSAEATQQLEKAQAEEKADIEAFTEARTESQSRLFETSDTVEVMQEQVRMMNIMVQGLQSRLDLRKQQLLLSINQVLHDDGEKSDLSIEKGLIAEAENARENISRQLSLRQRQVVAWAGENDKAANKWWQQFEKIDSGLGQVRDLIGDVERYENAQLYVYRQHQGWWRTISERFLHQLKTLQTSWRNLANYKLFTISEQPITVKNIAQMILVIIAAWIVSRLLGWLLRRMVYKNRTSEHAAYNLGRVLNYCIVLITFLIVLAMVGLDTSRLTLIAGALSVGIGFGMQAIFSNFISGIILLFEQPLRVGDLVELESGVFGRIRDINVRSTRITTRDNVDILVPNSEFVTGRVINHTLEDPVRRVHIPFGVAYGTDPEAVREAAMEAAERVPVTFTNWQRKTEVWLSAFGDSSLDFKLVVWVNSNAVTALGDLAALYNLELLEEFSRRGIEIPYPQRDVHVRSWGDPPVALDQGTNRDLDTPEEGADRSSRAVRRGSQGVEDWPAEDRTGDDGEGDDGDGGDGDGGSPSH